jgi:ferrochelatase
MFFNHPGWVEANADHVLRALAGLPGRSRPHLAFTAHSIPVAMAQACRYEDQLRESARLVAEAVGVDDWELVYQSRSGPPHVPWLEPDILDHLDAIAERGVTELVISPIGFVSDHLEVLFDLDVEARDRAAELGLELVRASSASTHPTFVAMIRELIEERLGRVSGRASTGRYAASHDVCPVDCCLPGTGRAPGRRRWPERPARRPAVGGTQPTCVSREGRASRAGQRAERLLDPRATTARTGAER